MQFTELSPYLIAGAAYLFGLSTGFVFFTLFQFFKDKAEQEEKVYPDEYQINLFN